MSGHNIYAEVIGTSVYKLEIKISDDEDIGASCSCPYDFGGFCKHIVAVLVSLSDDYKNINSTIQLQEVLSRRNWNIYSI